LSDRISKENDAKGVDEMKLEEMSPGRAGAYAGFLRPSPQNAPSFIKTTPHNRRGVWGDRLGPPNFFTTAASLSFCGVPARRGYAAK
jgi:hypothetical protein